MWRRLLMLVCALLLHPLAAAHPVALRVVAHDVDVIVDADQVRITYTVDVPVRGEGGDPRFALPDELVEGIRLELDGVRLPLEPDPLQAPAVRGDSHTLGVRMHLVGALDDGGVLTVSNHNYPDLQGYFATELRVTPGWVVLDASLFDRDGTRIVRDRNGRWGAGDANRVATVTLRRAPLTGWVDRLGGASGPVPIQHAMRRSMMRSWLSGSMTPALLGLLLVLGAALGALARATGPPPRLVAVATLLTAVAVLAPPYRVVSVSLAGVVVLALGWSLWKDEPWIAPLAAAPALVGAAQHPGWAALIAIAVAIGAGVARPASPPRAAVLAPCAVTALVVLARGMGGFL